MDYTTSAVAIFAGIADYAIEHDLLDPCGGHIDLLWQIGAAVESLKNNRTAPQKN